jgi:nitroimidazol reductase NimA-like FMN-containing flavoprotein (pyridoxamine 5'-phosphate oxidase superfamily)/8-oxo-dGTP pyrophosphatase MutT (NUDIX family)
VSDPIGPGRRSRVRRLPDLAHYDEASVFAVLDAGTFGHLAGVVDGAAVSLPTLYFRRGRQIFLHASQSNALIRAVLNDQTACFSVAIFDGWRLARSGFESSVAYRSAVVFGPLTRLEGDEARDALDDLVERCVPGRNSELRPMSAREFSLSQVVVLSIEEASVKISAGPTDDDEVDQALSIWSGVVPVRTVYGAVLASSDGAMALGEVPIPESVRRLVDPSRPAWTERVALQLSGIDPVNVREAHSIEALRDRLQWAGDPANETADPRHVTASSFVLSERGVILHRHKILDIWVQPGGHIDAGESPEDAATREVLEETGLTTHAPPGDELFHVDVHQGPRGHTHFDLRYVRLSDGSEPAPALGESPDVLWLDFDEAIARGEPSLAGALAKLAALVSAGKWES